MSSGYFPLSASEEKAKELQEIALKLRKMSNDYYYMACEDLNGEDAAQDGNYHCYLSLSAELLERCIRK